ncbi:hypothetical protein VA7868_02892 [Vibrio aerogenes CECT 7868]|uniref:Uncharacterized protein n=1 Tax=Vibrio aerogenes CECT 7868 TaxID=1216006 RepID=A0A1M5ZMB8_9VIBR|nr:hypothetical protein [Vibrio aerogenes]SHI25073.1 hypothetical protein VA7868_02892 [Vibrio aerogenes CECT 7868]
MDTFFQLVRMTSRTHPEMKVYLDVIEEEAEKYAGSSLISSIEKVCNESQLMNELFTEDERILCEIFLISQIQHNIVH